ncbi:inorganic phosphate transporter Pho88 [Schizophyllum amplum]|uniref:Inorganic phosphate transporter Pho88 n=1 Tax=Schizophyllum amplum TaxID=97359 RepID=A0A550CZS3_9AGAR|nr:inorganic phosphate transporter Pho88 [Auriculariopsis ampla]
MNSAVQNMVTSLVLMQVGKRIPFENPDVLNYARMAYVAIQVIILGTYYFISTKIKAKDDKTVLKYVEPPNPMSGQSEGELVTTTVRDYDLAEVSKSLKGVYMGIGIIAVMHLYFNFTQPLFMQSCLGLKGLYDSKMVQLYILGHPAEGDLKRPFKATASMFGAAAPGPQTDNATIQAAEKRTAKKDE